MVSTLSWRGPLVETALELEEISLEATENRLG